MARLKDFQEWVKIQRRFWRRQLDRIKAIAEGRARQAPKNNQSKNQP